jgi:hypothetical protein
MREFIRRALDRLVEAVSGPEPQTDLQTERQTQLTGLGEHLRWSYWR